MPIIVTRYFVADIDTNEAWEMAELLYTALHLKALNER